MLLCYGNLLSQEAEEVDIVRVDEGRKCFFCTYDSVCFVLFKCAMYVLVVRLRRYLLWMSMPELCLCLLLLLLLLLPLHSVGEEGNVRTLRVSASSCFKVLFPATAVLCFTSVLLRVAAGEYWIALE